MEYDNKEKSFDADRRRVILTPGKNLDERPLRYKNRLNAKPLMGQNKCQGKF